MNAYDLLEINDLLDEENNRGSYIDVQIRNRAKRKIDECIAELKQLFNQGADITESLMLIEKKLGETIQYAIAYDVSETAKTRTDYEKKGKPDMSEFLAKMNRLLNKAYTLTTGGKASSAYQILGVVKDERCFRTPEEQNQNIRTRAFNSASFTISNSKMNDIDSIETTLLNVVRYIWAYSNISTVAKRKEYKYKELASKSESFEKSMATPEARELKRKKLCLMQPVENTGCTRIDLSEVAILQSCPFVVPERHAEGYVVSKHKTDGTIKEENIFSNIDMLRLQEDSEYQLKVQKMLLSDEAISLGRKYFGGYVGELDKDGNLTFETEAIAASKKWMHIRELNRREEEKSKRNRGLTGQTNPGEEDRE